MYIYNMHIYIMTGSSMHGLYMAGSSMQGLKNFPLSYIVLCVFRLGLVCNYCIYGHFWDYSDANDNEFCVQNF